GLAQHLHGPARQLEVRALRNVEDLGQARIFVAAQRCVDDVVGDDARIIFVIADATQSTFRQTACVCDTEPDASGRHDVVSSVLRSTKDGLSARPLHVDARVVRPHGPYATMIGGTSFKSHRAIAVMRASSFCCPMICTPTGIACTAIRGMVTAGANSIELGKLNTGS